MSDRSDDSEAADESSSDSEAMKERGVLGVPGPDLHAPPLPQT